MNEARNRLMVLVYLALDPHGVLPASRSAAEDRTGEGLGRCPWVPRLPGEHRRAFWLSLSSNSPLHQPFSAMLSACIIGLLYFFFFLFFFSASSALGVL